MARPRKNGLFYFSFDTDFFYSDRRIRALLSRFGSDGVVLLIWIWTEIYRNTGYFLKWNDETIDNAMADLGLAEGLIKQVMEFLYSRSLLTKLSTLAISDTIITSPGIQKRYQEALKGQKRDFEVISEIWLLEKEETASFIKVNQKQGFSEKNKSFSKKNASFSEKNCKKEKKVNKNKIKENIYRHENVQESEKVFFEDEKLNKTFIDFIAFRKELKKPLVGKGIDLAIKKLKDIAGNDNELAIKIIEQSMIRAWPDFYNLAKSREFTQEKNSKAYKPKVNRFTNFEQRQDEIDEDSLYKEILKEI